ncbi:hypothetical protein [Roseobacter phage RDJL6]|nr:hypothetical protein [Roseobacter phage RDJL6]
MLIDQQQHSAQVLASRTVEILGSFSLDGVYKPLIPAYPIPIN